MNDIIVRTPAGERVAAAVVGRLRLQDATPEEMVASQTETYRVKRDVLRGRLALRAAAARPVPAYPGLDLRAGARDTLLGALDAGRELRMAARGPAIPVATRQEESTMTAEPGPASGGCRDTPASLGYRMPAEWEPHQRCIMGWPTELRIDSVWGEHYLLAMASYAAVAHAIAHFEPVLMLARPGEGAVARSYLGRDVEVVELPIDDSWLRDSGPTFVTHPDGTLAMSDFTFNSWGEKYVPVRERRGHRRAARRALRRGAVRRPHGPRGRRHHRRRRGHADDHRELPAPPVAQPRPHQG